MTTNPLKKIISWLGPDPDPEADPEAEAEERRLRTERDTIRTSQLMGPGGMMGPVANIPPTPDVLDPEDR